MVNHVRLGAAAVLCAAAALSAAFVFGSARQAVHAQTPVLPCMVQKPFSSPPEIRLGGNRRATLKLVSGQRMLWGSEGENTCNSQWLRYFVGSGPEMSKPWPSGSDPIPGPTFRAKLGDLVEITFFNQVDKTHFAKTLDRGTIGTMEACDQYVRPKPNKPARNSASAQKDTYPDCIHGSSTTNVHFHGTHTTPSTTGDNVLLFIPPWLPMKGTLQPTEAQAKDMLGPFFTACETTHRPSAANPWPRVWGDMPQRWRDLQASLINTYDTTTLANGKPIPTNMRLSAVDQYQINHGAWPQYQIGANPYCWPIPVDPNLGPTQPVTTMGQSPGTHWYHAHKHGSTALNVANGMTGVFIIEGAHYDGNLHAYYGSAFKEQVMMLQQLSSNPFPFTSGGNVIHPGAPRARISVNGQLNPTVAMQPGEVQMWRVVNGAFRDSVQFVGSVQTTSGNPPSNPCPTTFPAPSTSASVQWKQIAQDGVQFKPDNYDQLPANNQLDMAPASRADFLVQAPTTAGSYAVCIVRNQGATIDLPNSSPGAYPKPPNALVTVLVGGTPVSGNLGNFIPSSDPNFPAFPTFLRDILPNEIKPADHKTVTFGGPAGLVIDGRAFRDGYVNQTMKLGHAEQWIVRNLDQDKEHPFHIHINPFQVVAVFEPNAPQALEKGNTCYVDPLNPSTWIPCPGRQSGLGNPGHWIWWDTFAIPSARQVNITSSCPGGVSTACPQAVQQYTQCSGGTCTEVIPGWYKMNSRFVDFTGQYVLHCHILVHEDRGMMQLVEVVPDTPGPIPPKRKSIYHHH